jgi:K+ transporter
VFFSAATLKIVEGGWCPLAVGVVYRHVHLAPGPHDAL